MQSELMTVSGIAKATGLDRRTIDRALIDLLPLEIAESAGRASHRYDVFAAARKLIEAKQPREKVARMLPFCGSPGRFVAWNLSVASAQLLLEALAEQRATWRAEYGVTDAAADAIASRFAVTIAATFDAIQADLSTLLPDLDALESSILERPSVARNAGAGEFLKAVTNISGPFAEILAACAEQS